MRINKQNHTKRNTILASILSVLLIIGGYLIYAYTSDAWPFQSQKDTTSTAVEGSTTDGAENTDTKSAEQTPTTKQPTQPENKEEAKNGNIATPAILSAKQINADQIRVSANFSTIANGTCELTLSKPSETNIQKTTDIIIVPGGYACDGFLVNVPSSGGWTATVTHLHDGLKSSSQPREVE